MKAGDNLPEAETTTTGVTVATVWKDSNGDEVTGTFSAAGEYSAEITVTATTGYELAAGVTYTLNTASASLEGGVLKTTATVAAADQT